MRSAASVLVDAGPLIALVNRDDAGALVVAEPAVQLMQRMRALMEKYRDTPMDLGDASLVALAEERDIRRFFTLDGDFRIYRIGRRSFEIVP